MLGPFLSPSSSGASSLAANQPRAYSEVYSNQNHRQVVCPTMHRYHHRVRPRSECQLLAVCRPLGEDHQRENLLKPK